MVLHTKRGRAIAIAVSKTPRETFAVTATLERDGTRATTPTRGKLGGAEDALWTDERVRAGVDVLGRFAGGRGVR